MEGRPISYCSASTSPASSECGGGGNRGERGQAVLRITWRCFLGPVVVASGMALVACGSTTHPSGTSVVGGATTAPGSNSVASSGGGALNLARLSSLTDYSFTATAGNAGYTFTVTGEVHDPTDWQTHSATPAVTNYDVGGRGYAIAIGQVTPVSFKTPEGLTHLDGETTYAQALVGYTHVTGIRIATAGPCRVAGVEGTTYQVKTPGASASLLLETATACVANGSGALLSYSSGVGGSAASAVHIAGAGTSFTVTAIGGIGPIAAPGPTPTTSVPTIPPNLGSAPGLPAGFPSQVPVPPGQISSSTALGSAKWYVQLTESGSAALADYVKVLQGKGFNVVSSTNSAAADVATLADGSFQVQVEQISIPGQGVSLAVTVASNS